MSTNATGHSATTIGRVEAIDLDVALVDPMVVSECVRVRVGVKGLGLGLCDRVRVRVRVP